MIRLLISIFLLQWSNAFQFSSSLTDKYDLSPLVGLHDVSLVRDTPPSLSNFTVYLNIIDSETKDTQIHVDNCPPDSQLCGLNTVSVPGKDPIVTEIISFPNNLKVSEDETDETISILMTGANWGKNSINAYLTLMCSSDHFPLEIQNWDGQDLNLFWKSPHACLKKNSKNPPPPSDDKKPPSDEPDDSSSWGWFTWLFIFMVIIFAGYVIGNAWINANSTGSNEFLNELTDSLVDVLNRLPSFLKEIWNKIFGNSERGGYSAV